MSYSFSVRGATKAEVKEKVAAELDKVVASQPIHAADRKQAESAVQSFLDVLPDASGPQDFSVSVHGSLGWSGMLGEAGQMLTSASVGVSAALIAKA